MKPPTEPGSNMNDRNSVLAHIDRISTPAPGQLWTSTDEQHRLELRSVVEGVDDGWFTRHRRNGGTCDLGELEVEFLGSLRASERKQERRAAHREYRAHCRT